jgi:uncharacterized repeat protein (TIGR01451 family)
MKTFFYLIGLCTTLLNYAQIPTPIITVSTPTCDSNGLAIITNLNPNYTYTFSPTGPAWSNTGQIIGLQCGTFYTVTASEGGQTSPASVPFSIGCQFYSPINETTSGICICLDENGIVIQSPILLTNENPSNNSFEWTFTNSEGTTISLNVTTDSHIATDIGTYVATVTTNNGCSASKTFSVQEFTTLSTPEVCVTNGQAFVNNYNPNYFYITTPAGLTILPNGQIAGVISGQSYTVTAYHCSCWSTSLPFDTAQPNSCQGFLLEAFVDSNNNGIKNDNEYNFPLGTFNYIKNNVGISHQLYVNNGIAYIPESNPSNSYQFNYAVLPEYASYFDVSVSSYSNANISGQTVYYFPIVPNTTYYDLTVSIIPNEAPRAGFDYFNTIIYSNQSPNLVPSGTIIFTKDEAITLNNTIPSTNITANGFTYDFTNLQPFETRVITVNMFTPPLPTVVINQPITHSASITPLVNDAFPNNNNFNLTQNVIAAYDPNDKMEARGSKIVFADYNPNDEFTYTIRFENEGNANAINIRITDELDAKIDETSVRIINASHDYRLERINNQLTWYFDNIDLPVSVPNTMIGHGYVTFSVKMKPGIQLGDEVPNFASIYFDTNPPIITNTFVTEFYEPLSISTFDNQVSIYPNPTSDILNFQTNEDINQLKIYSITGQLLQSFEKPAKQINLSNFTQGIYKLKLDINGKIITKKLIKK